MARGLGAVFLLVAVVGFGCASGQSAPAEKSGQAASAIAAVPDDSPLAQIQVGMSDSEVRKILGEPSSQNAYMTGKSWIPFYYGPDTSRTDYVYDGIGRVVFSRNQYSGQLKVINLIAETGGSGG